jgi:triphosphoribosyl-dephospho-CoA synthase
MNATGFFAQLACIWEATARKPGNVHRFCDFSDTHYLDFLMSAAAVAPVLEAAYQQPVGVTVLECVRATRRVVGSNTNLGIVLLLAPLAAVPAGADLRNGLKRVLQLLDVDDSRAVFDAIRLANPGGLGQAPEQDVREEPTLPLREIMCLAAGRDRIALQYVNGFAQVFDEGVPALRRGLELSGTLEGAIVHCHLCLLASHPDSLIARKHGPAEAEAASRRAQQILDAGWPATEGQQLCAELDAWLRAEGHARNPGTTADLVTASLFVALREGIMKLPLTYPWSTEPCHGRTV